MSPERLQEELQCLPECRNKPPSEVIAEYICERYELVPKRSKDYDEGYKAGLRDASKDKRGEWARLDELVEAIREQKRRQGQMFLYRPDMMHVYM